MKMPAPPAPPPRIDEINLAEKILCNLIRAGHGSQFTSGQLITLTRSLVDQFKKEFVR